MRINAKGQVTIPRAIREKLGFAPDTEIEFRVEGDSLRLTKERPLAQSSIPGETRGQWAVRLLREGAKHRVDLSTDEILKMTRGK